MPFFYIDSSEITNNFHENLRKKIKNQDYFSKRIELIPSDLSDDKEFSTKINSLLFKDQTNSKKFGDSIPFDEAAIKKIINSIKSEGIQEITIDYLRYINSKADEIIKINEEAFLELVDLIIKYYNVNSYLSWNSIILQTLSNITNTFQKLGKIIIRSIDFEKTRRYLENSNYQMYSNIIYFIPALLDLKDENFNDLFIKKGFIKAFCAGYHLYKSSCSIMFLERVSWSMANIMYIYEEDYNNYFEPLINLIEELLFIDPNNYQIIHWALLALARSTAYCFPDWAKKLIDKTGISYLVKLLMPSVDKKVFEVSIQILGNCILFEYRDDEILLVHKVHRIILEFLNKVGISSLKNCAYEICWFLYIIIIEKKNKVNEYLEEGILPHLITIIMEQDFDKYGQEEAAKLACIILQNITDNQFELILKETKFFHALIYFIGYKNFEFENSLFIFDTITLCIELKSTKKMRNLIIQIVDELTLFESFSSNVNSSNPGISRFCNEIMSMYHEYKYQEEFS